MAGFISDEERKRILAAMLSGQIGRRPPPVQATAATPLPGVPMEQAIIAPQSEQAVVAPPPQQYDELAVVRELLPQRQAPVTGNKEIDAILASQAQAQSGAEQNLINILKGAQMNPLEKGILEARRARAQKEQAELEKEQKLSGWDALARAGFAMAQSNSPYFMQALASGLEAGVKGLDESKLKADEKRARLQAAEEDTVLAEIRGNQAAQERLMSIYNAARALGKSEMEARDMAIKSAVTLKTLPQQLEMVDLEVKAKKADIDYTKANTARALREPRGGSSGGGGDGTPGPRPLPPGARAEAQGRLATAYSEQDEAYREWVAAGKPIIGKVEEGSDGWSAASKYEAARGKVNNILNILGKPSLGPAPTRTGGQRITQAQRRAAAPRPAAAQPKSKPKPAGYPDAKRGTDGEWYVVRGGKTYKVEG